MCWDTEADFGVLRVNDLGVVLGHKVSRYCSSNPSTECCRFALNLGIPLCVGGVLAKILIARFRIPSAHIPAQTCTRTERHRLHAGGETDAGFVRAWLPP